MRCDKRETIPENIHYKARAEGYRESFIYVSAPDIDKARQLAENDRILKVYLEKGIPIEIWPLLDKEGNPVRTKIPTRVFTCYEIIEWRREHYTDIYDGRG